jgi:hypothetical protein
VTRTLISAAIVIAAVALAMAQTKPAPPPFSADELSGMYSFLREGEFVQINLEADGRVTGFISRYGDLESDRGVFLDQFFTKGSIDGPRLTFETRPVHGVWFEFKGTVDRGPAKSQSEDAYYVLKGTLIQYISDENKKTSARSREVTFKSFPQESFLDPRQKD